MTNAPITLPVDFDLNNADEEQTLFITDDVSGQELTLEITNTSDKPTTPKKLTPKVSAAVHHFELIFRPGTLYNNPTAVELEGTQFEMFIDKDSTGAIKSNADGTLSLYFKSKSTWTLQQGEKVAINLKQIRAATPGGTRGTRVMLKYRNLLHAGNTEIISGFREMHLNIVNHRGKRNIPLHAGFVGHNTVLNDGNHPNTLHLRITNSWRKNLPIHSSADSKLILVLEGGPASEEWTIATKSQVDETAVTYKHPGVLNAEDANKATGSNQWEIPFVKLDKGQAIDIHITKLITNHKTGHANLFLHYEDIPGYWDGEYVAVIEKTPLVFDDKNVGIGTTSPKTLLHVNGPITSNDGLVGTPTNGAYGGAGQRLVLWPGGSDRTPYGLGIDNFSLWYGVPGDAIHAWYTQTTERMRITKDGNVGIGTTTPGAKLTVVPVKNSRGFEVLSPSAGNTHLPWTDNWNYISGDGVIFRDATHTEKTRIDFGSGNVGIGTVSPIARLHVSGFAPVDMSNYGWLNNKASFTTGIKDRQPNASMSIYATHRIAAAEFNAHSDQRIKNIINHSDTQQDLNTLCQLEVTDFTYVDRATYGDQTHKKLIAQQVQEVFPQAVKSCKSFIPDIYAMSEFTIYDHEQQQLTVSMHNVHTLTPGDRVRIADEKGSHELEVREVNEDRNFVIAHNRDCEQVFVYGKEVDDLLTLDYEEIAMLNLSATQALSQQMEILRQENADLKAEIEALKMTV